MRFRTLVVWALFLGGLIWAGFIVVGAGSSYFATQELVDSAVSQSNTKRKAQAAIGSPTSLEEVMSELRSVIVRASRHTDLPLDERQLSVQADTVGIRIHVKWAYPVLTYGDQTYLAIPLSVERVVEFRG